MNIEEPYEAEAEAEAVLRIDSQQHMTSILAQNTFSSSDEEVPNETEPLLDRSKTRHSRRSNRSRDNVDTDAASENTASWDELEDLPWWKRPSVWWLLPPFTFLTIAFGGTLVPKLQIILGLICRDYFAERQMRDPTFHFMPVIEGEDNPQCRIPEVQSLVSKFTLYGGLITGILSAIVSPKLGILSDRRGRLVMMAVSASGMILSEAVFIVVASFPDTFSVYNLLVSNFFEGLGGSFIAAMALSYSYAADCTSTARRNVVFGYYHGCLFGGLAIGPLFAGYVVKATGNILSIFYVAIVAHITFALLCLFVIPESLSKERQAMNRMQANAEKGDSKQRTVLSRMKDVIHVFAPLSVLWPTERGTSPDVRRNLVLLAAVDTTMFGVAMGAMNILLIYANYAFGWGNFENSVLMTVVNSCRVFVLLAVLPLATRVFKGPISQRDQNAMGCDLFDLSVIRIAIFADLMGYLGYSVVRHGSLFILSGALTSFGGMGSPTLQSALTKHVPPERTGQVLGAMGLLHASARVVAPIIFNLIYAETVGKFTQTVFVCLAATFGIAFAFAWFIKPHVSWKPLESEGSVVDAEQRDHSATEHQS